MADPKNVIVDIKNGLSDVRQQMNLLKQDTAGWVSSLSSGVSRMSSGGGGGGGGGGGVSSTLVAANPKFTPPATQGGGGGNAMVPYQPMGGNIVANTPSINANVTNNGVSDGGYTGNTNLTRYIGENPAAGALYAASLTSGMLDQPGESVESQLLTARASYFNNFKNIGSAQAYNNMKGTIGDLSDKATITNKLDVQRGLAAAQSMGISGPNVIGGANSVAAGVATASNLIPGQGFEGTMRAFGSMQQGRNVNMLRGIGIQIRDQDGNMKPPDQIIDDLWKKICRDYSANYGAGKKPSKREMQIGLQPGNSMDSMLDLYFGNDPMAKQMIANGLLFKAETGGEAISKEKLQELGATTEAALASSNRASKATKQTMATQDAGATGYTAAANLLADTSDMITKNMLGPLKDITEANAYIMTLLGGANDTGSKALAAVTGLSGKKGILAMAGVAATAFGLKGLYGGEEDNGPFGEAGGTPSGVNYSANPKAAKLHQFLVSQGIAPAASAGVIGNLVVESNINPKAVGDGGNSLGIAQWHKGRKEALINYAKKLGLDPTSMEAQQSFLIKELQQNQYKDLMAKLTNPKTTTADAADAFMRVFERPKLHGEGDAKGDAQAAARAAAGLKALGINGNSVSSLNTNTGGTNTGSTNTGGNTYNYGGVTIKVDATGKTVQQFFDEFKRKLEDEELLKGASNK